MKSNAANIPRRLLFSIPRSAFRVIRSGSAAQPGKRRLAQNEEVVGSNPTRTTPPPPRHSPDRVDPLSMAILFAQQFKGW
jgi:hypothetical protein